MFQPKIFGIGVLMLQVLCSNSVLVTLQTVNSSRFISQTFNSSARDEKLKNILLTFGQNKTADCQTMSTMLSNVSDIKEYLETLGNGSINPCKAMAACAIRSSSELGSRCPAEIDFAKNCYPETYANSTVLINCPAVFRGIWYNTSDHLSRYCRENGRWGDKAQYCRALSKPLPWTESMKILANLSLAGRIVSLVSLVIAFFLFWKLKSIRCWRIIIHWNLTTSLILKNVFWIAMRYGIGYNALSQNTVYCRLLVTLFKYSHASNFFWMLVEGIYLYMMVVMAFVCNKIKLKYYLLIGWLGPTSVTLSWVLSTIFTENKFCWTKSNPSKPPYIVFAVPILTILLVNTVILASIIRVLLKKLRSQTSQDDLGRYWKATKAAVFLFPLLGGTYLIFLISPQKGSVGQTLFLYINTILQSFQGFLVCVIYCFANAEVRNSLTKKIQNWKNQHNLICWKNYSRRSSLSMTTNTIYLVKPTDEAITNGSSRIRLHSNPKIERKTSSTETMSLVTHKSVGAEINNVKQATSKLL